MEVPGGTAGRLDTQALTFERESAWAPCAIPSVASHGHFAGVDGGDRPSCSPPDQSNARRTLLYTLSVTLMEHARAASNAMAVTNPSAAPHHPP